MAKRKDTDVKENSTWKGTNIFGQWTKDWEAIECDRNLNESGGKDELQSK